MLQLRLTRRQVPRQQTALKSIMQVITADDGTKASGLSLSNGGSMHPEPMRAIPMHQPQTANVTAQSPRLPGKLELKLEPGTTGAISIPQAQPQAVQAMMGAAQGMTM